MLVPRHEVGLGIDLDDHALVARRHSADQAVGGNAAGLLGRFRQALLAQPILCRLHVAGGFGKGCLTIHHAGAGGLAEVLDHCCCDRSHCERPSCLSGRPQRGPASPLSPQELLHRKSKTMAGTSRPLIPPYSASAVRALAWVTQASARLGSPTSSPILWAVS